MISSVTFMIFINPLSDGIQIYSIENILDLDNKAQKGLNYEKPVNELQQKRRILLSIQNLAGIGILVPDRVHMQCTRFGTHI